ncbi:diguanylate cyclase [Roseospirillum parvum]|uniref:diguanylate cyclase n=1 Tax=Roseospirillum parvum TaxID=83401 RepID=A0A1G7ZA19_9PROT|nr:diguanylate cyclase [Roseospirillum parvum]SDH05548.1 PAS domain S-box-containing protein/diguanylate cyclase (GGDEF) domain-containing protein [Roseospirillum parvum]
MPARFQPRLTIRARLAIITLAGLVVLGGLGLFTVRGAYRALEVAYGQSMAETAQAMLGQIGGSVVARLDQLERLSDRAEVTARMRAANRRPLDAGPDTVLSELLRDAFIDAERRRFGRSVFAQVVLIDRRGLVVAATDPPARPLLADRTWWRGAMARGRHVGGLAYDPLLDAHGLVVAVRLDDARGQPLGVAKALLSAGWIIREAAQAAQLAGNTDIHLVTADTRQIFSTRPFRFLEHVDDRRYVRASRAATGNGAGGDDFVQVTEGGRARVYAFASSRSAPALGHLGWTLFVGRDARQVLAPAEALELRISVAYAVVLLAGLFAAGLLARSLARPVLRIRDAASKIAEGDLEQRVDLKRDDEIGDLAAAFNLMSDRLRDSYHALTAEIAVRQKAEADMAAQAHRALESEIELNTLIESTDDFIWFVDREGRLVLWNSAVSDYRAQRGKGPVRRGITAADMLPADKAAEWEELYRRTLSGERPIIELELSDGRHQTFAFAPMMREGEVIGASVFSRDITVRRAMERQLEQLASTDPLTGASNRRRFMKQAQVEWERSQRYDSPLSLLMIDIDHFKSINDTHGHAIGDKVLKAMVMECIARLRGTDLLGRLGGEEFAVLLPQTPAAAAAQTAERLRQALAELSVATDNGPLRFTVSLGLACRVGAEDTVEECLRRADAALYKAKAGGRDRLVVDPSASGVALESDRGLAS